jgi:hypothetical protein
LDHVERRLLMLVDATASTLSQAAGQVGVSVPVLPADATTTTLPVTASFTSACSTPAASGSVVPKLMLITAACRATA